MKPFTPNYTPVFAELPTLADLDAQEVIPEAILERRLVKKGNRAVPQVLIKWTNVPAATVTWEDLYVVQKRFPQAVTWGQVTSASGEDVSPSEETVTVTRD